MLDNELISVPYIDFQQNPDGIDGAQRLADLGRLHDQVRPGPREPAQDRRAADQARADLARRRSRRRSASRRSTRASSPASPASPIVALFLLVFYRVLGVIAVGALVIYAIYFFALIKLIPITLTLPGIAGLILTIGVAADANIVIFERVKEEIRAGRSVHRGHRRGLQEGPRRRSSTRTS